MKQKEKLEKRFAEHQNKYGNVTPEARNVLMPVIVESDNESDVELDDKVNVELEKTEIAEVKIVSPKTKKTIKKIETESSKNTQAESSKNNNVYVDSDGVIQDGELKYINPTALLPYPDRKLAMKLYSGKKRKDLRTSIIESGIINPVIVSQKENGDLIILAGHNRADIARELEIDVKCIVKTGLTENEEKLIVLDTNLFNRSIGDMLPSELAFTLEERCRLNNQRGKRTDLIPNAFEYNTKLDSDDLTCGQIGTKLNESENAQGIRPKTSDIVGKDYKLSSRNVRRYIRLTELNDKLINQVDTNKIALNAGVSLSYLKPEEQEHLANYLEQNSITISIRLADKLKTISAHTDDIINVEEVINKHFEIKEEKELVLSVSFNHTELMQMIPVEFRNNPKEYIIRLMQEKL